jgi:hypothetical protein
VPYFALSAMCTGHGKLGICFGETGTVDGPLSLAGSPARRLLRFFQCS